MALDALERHHILRVLEYTKGNKAEAARLLGIGIATLYRKLESYGMKPDAGARHIILRRPPYHFDRAAVLFGRYAKVASV